MNTRRIFVAIAVLVMLCRAGAQAVVLDTDVEVTAEVTSEYLWRGQVINDEPCFQPDIRLKAAGVSLDIWGTWDLTDGPSTPERTRTDITIDYTGVSGRSILKSGMIAYIYHDDPAGRIKDTFEAFFDYTLDVKLLPSVRIYYDFAQIDGLYGFFRLAHSFDMRRKTKGVGVALDLDASVGFANKNYNNAKFSFPANPALRTAEFVPDKSALVDLTTSVSTPILLGERVTLTPEVKYMTLLDSDIKDGVKAAGRKTDGVACSLALTVLF